MSTFIGLYIYRKPKEEEKVNTRLILIISTFPHHYKKNKTYSWSSLSVRVCCGTVCVWTEGGGKRGMRTRWWRLEAALRCRCCWCCGRATLHRRRQNWMSGGRFPSSRQPNPLIQTQPLLHRAAYTQPQELPLGAILFLSGISFVWQSGSRN